MKAIPTLLACFLLTTIGGVFALGQDPQDEDKPRSRSPFTAYLEDEQKRITEEIEGSWTLLSLETNGISVDIEDFRGYAQFHDGYVSLMIMSAGPVEVFFGTEIDYAILSGAYRFQVSEDVTLQLASLLGFDNLYSEGFEFHDASDAREFELMLEEDRLTLREPAGDRFEFARLGGGAFPDTIADRLRSRRSGWDFDVDDR